jgi:hypothetical protein
MRRGGRASFRDQQDELIASCQASLNRADARGHAGTLNGATMRGGGSRIADKSGAVRVVAGDGLACFGAGHLSSVSAPGKTTMCRASPHLLVRRMSPMAPTTSDRGTSITCTCLSSAPGISERPRGAGGPARLSARRLPWTPMLACRGTRDRRTDPHRHHLTWHAGSCRHPRQTLAAQFFENPGEALHRRRAPDGTRSLARPRPPLRPPVGARPVALLPHFLSDEYNCRHPSTPIPRR